MRERINHNPVYIGDGVYVSRDAYNRLVITTGHDDARKADNVIVFEPEVLAELLDYLKLSPHPKTTSTE